MIKLKDFLIKLDTDIANHTCTDRNHVGRRQEIASGFQESHDGQEHSQQ